MKLKDESKVEKSLDDVEVVKDEKLINDFVLQRLKSRLKMWHLLTEKLLDAKMSAIETFITDLENKVKDGQIRYAAAVLDLRSLIKKFSTLKK